MHRPPPGQVRLPVDGAAVASSGRPSAASGPTMLQRAARQTPPSVAHSASRHRRRSGHQPAGDAAASRTCTRLIRAVSCCGRLWSATGIRAAAAGRESGANLLARLRAAVGGARRHHRSACGSSQQAVHFAAQAAYPGCGDHRWCAGRGPDSNHLLLYRWRTSRLQGSVFRRPGGGAAQGRLPGRREKRPHA